MGGREKRRPDAEAVGYAEGLPVSASWRGTGPRIGVYILGKHPIYLIYDSGHTNIPQVLEIWPNIPIYLMQAGQQSKYQYTSPTHVITIRYVIDMEYTRCDRIGRF